MLSPSQSVFLTVEYEVAQTRDILIHFQKDTPNWNSYVTERVRVPAGGSFKKIKLTLEKQKEGKIYIVLDNARYYHANIVKEFLKNHPRIVLKFLPPYAPNLNIIERLWEILKMNVVYNKFYQKFNNFIKAVIRFLENKLWLEDRFKNLLIDNF